MSNEHNHEAKAAPAVPQGERVSIDREQAESWLSAMERVIDVADRKTDEFDSLRKSIIDLTLLLHATPSRHAAHQDMRLVPLSLLQELESSMHALGQGLDFTSVDSDRYSRLREVITATPAAPSQERCCTCGYLTSEREHLGCLRKAAKDLDAATGGPYPSQPVNCPQNCGTSFCSCIECVCEPPQPVTLTDEWISVDDQKPPTNKPVLIHYLNERQRSKIVRAHYIPAKTVEAGEDDAADEYDEESDTYFVQEGWYEDNSESEVNYGITGQITHWRNLPPVPAIIAALREKAARAEPFGYFRAEPLGWTDCAATDEGAIALYDRPAAPAVPDTDELESALERLVERCNTDQFLCNDDAVIHAEATLERVYKSRKYTHTPAAPSQEPAVPQGEPPPLTDDLRQQLDVALGQVRYLLKDQAEKAAIIAALREKEQAK